MQTTEENEVRTTERPSCWQEPEEEIYWTVRGRFRSVQARQSGWTSVYRSAEEAEADAVIPGPFGFQWNKEPACSVRLTDAMRRARQLGREGVRVRAYKNGEWITLKEYPADVPLGH